MRSRFILLLLVGAAVSSPTAQYTNADNEHGWKVGQEYQYLVRSRTLTALNTLSDQYTGIIMKAILKIQCNSPDMLRAELLMPKYAQIHKELQDGWETQIPDQMLQYMDLPTCKQPFAIKMKHGVVRDLIIDKNAPTWEVNIIKSIVSQLQADTQGENGRRTKDIQIPKDKNPFAMFHVMEDSVGGKCEVLYDITPLPDYVLQDHRELVPKPELKGDGEHIYIMKTKNYEKCEERVDYHFGITGDDNWNSHRKNNRNFMTKSSSSSIVISGDLKSFAIQSSVTRNQIIIKPRLMDDQDSVVMNKMNLTLASISKVSMPIPAPSNPESTGNLVYAYNKPFSPTQHRRLRRPSISPNSNSVEFDDDSTWTNSNQDSGDVLASDEDGTILQSKPKLDEAPENPLLPLFIGNKGKAVLVSDKIDVAKNVKRLVDEISNELEDPNTIPEEETLEKFTILSRLIGSMSFMQIQKVERDLSSHWNEINSDEDRDVKTNARNVFRDAVTDAGTGPALLTIKDWIEKGTIEGFEAAEVMERLPKTARMPTDDYMDTLFALATNPEVQKQMHLNSSAIISFAELVYHAQVSNSSIHNNYPVHSFGRPSSRHDDKVITKYIPYMAEQLKKAIKDGDSPRIQVYIFALGSTGHPKILSVFEPYLEGKHQVSTFQRLLMVACLGRLAENRPALARSVFYKIYLNTWEAHQIRCTAVFLLMKLNPPSDMVLRMAKFTNYDYSKHVNSAVKSTINQAAELEDCKWREIAKQAQDYLNPSHYNYAYSRSVINDVKLSSKDLAYRIIFDYIGSDDSILPSAWYLSLQSTYGKFVAPADEAFFMISSVRNIIDVFNRMDIKMSKNKQMLVDKIVKMLNIESEYPEQAEGNYFVSDKYMSHFFAFDNHTLDRLPEAFRKQFMHMSQGQRINSNRFMSYDINLSFPTETGLPFVYSFRLPTLRRFVAKTKDWHTDFRLVISSKTQGRVGFVTPFDQQHFVSGIDMKTQAFIPGKVGVKMNPSKDGLKLEIDLHASRQNENIRMLHFSVVPYTSQHSVLSLRPVLLEKNTQIVSKEEPTHIRFPPEETESPFALEMKSEDIARNMEWWTLEDDVTDWLMFPLSLGRGALEKIDFYLKSGNQDSKPVSFKAILQSHNIRMDNPSESDDEAWNRGSKSPQVAIDIPISNERRSKFLRDVATGMNSGNAYVLDAALELPGIVESRHILTAAIAESITEGKFRSLFYWHTEVPNSGIAGEVCGNLQMQRKASPPFDFEKILKNNPKEEIQMNIRYGQKCSEGEEITAEGKFTQSEDYKEYVRDTDVAKQCKKKTKDGLKSLEDCETAAEMANSLDELTLSVNYDSERIAAVVDQGITMSKKALDTSNSLVSVRNHKNNPDNGISLYVRLSPDFKTLLGSMSAGKKSLTFSDVDLDEFGVESDDIQDIQNDDEFDCKATCTIDTNEAKTFDGKMYPVKLGKCSHVLAVTYPKINPKDHSKEWNLSDDMKLGIIAREVEDEKKEVTILLGEDKVTLKPSGSKLQAMVNDKPVDCSRKLSYQKLEADETIFEIYELPGPAIRLTSDTYDLDVTYDGERVEVKLPTNYKQSVRGLCGDFDGQPENDFVTPKNCVLKKPEEFAAMYALKEECEGEALKHAKMAETSMCTKKTIRLSDVISDAEAGRSTTNWKQWGYHMKGTTKQCNSYRTKVISKDNKICFTMRPVPMCSEGCKPVEMKEKKYQLHCMEKNSHSLAMKRRVEQGANPDLSQLPSSATETMSVPVACAAA